MTVESVISMMYMTTGIYIFGETTFERDKVICRHPMEIDVARSGMEYTNVSFRQLVPLGIDTVIEFDRKNVIFVVDNPCEILIDAYFDAVEEINKSLSDMIVRHHERKASSSKMVEPKKMWN